jgi:hypothetical protein
MDKITDEEFIDIIIKLRDNDIYNSATDSFKNGYQQALSDICYETDICL